MFRNREDAGLRLAQALKPRILHDPLVLAIPCGGVVVGSVLAQQLGAELDVVLSRKLRAPGPLELSIGAIAENGLCQLNHFAKEAAGVSDEYLDRERREQQRQIVELAKSFRAIRPRAKLAERSVILTDDGIATGSTILAVLPLIRSQQPRELIVAVPVASMESAQAEEEIRRACDDLVCLHVPKGFWSVDQFYVDFKPVSVEEAVVLLHESAARSFLGRQGAPEASVASKSSIGARVPRADMDKEC